MKTKREERMEKLVNAGLETGKYFTFELPEGLTAGSKIHLVFDESGTAKVVDEMEMNPIYDEIIEDGYVKNTRLHRRWVMAQMFRMLNYRSWDGRKEGYNEALKRYGYDYTFKMMLEEVRVLSKLETRDAESFAERSHFFTKDVVVKVCEDYMDKLKADIDKKPTKKCKGIPYKTIKGEHIFVEDLPKKIYQPLQYKINRIKWANNYGDIHRALSQFMRGMIRLPWDTPKSKDWIDAYKGNGAYYTLKNLLMFHNCTLIEQNGVVTRGTKAVDKLRVILDMYKGEGWRMFALMKAVIEFNNFSFENVMKEQYGEDYRKRYW